MCFDPVSAMTAIAKFATAHSTSISMLGAGVGALGQYQQAQGAKTAAKYNAAVADANAKVSEFKAQDAIDRAQTNAEDLGRRQAAMRGRQQATIAANGMDLSSQSAQSILDATDYYGLADQREASNAGSREAWGFRTQGANYQAEAQMQRNRASSISPLGAAATSLLGSAGGIADKWTAKNPTAKQSSWSWAVGPQ
jgi:hypothetical protein